MAVENYSKCFNLWIKKLKNVDMIPLIEMLTFYV